MCNCGKKKVVEPIKPKEDGRQTDKPADSGGSSTPGR
jgi:hypothetical protein